MHIALISRHMTPDIGGTEAFVEEFLKLADRTPNVTADAILLEPTAGRKALQLNIALHYVRSKFVQKLLWRFRTGRNRLASIPVFLLTTALLVFRSIPVFIRKRPNVIYAVGGPIAATAGVVLKALFRIPLVTHYHSMYRFRDASVWTRSAARRFYSYADKLVGNCDMLIQDATALGIPAARCHGVLNWVDQEFFRPMDRAGARAAFGLQPGETAFLFAGLLDVGKHVHLVIEALESFDFPGCVFFFAGEGRFSERLEILGSQKSNVRYLGGVNKEVVRKLHNACDVQLWGSVDVAYPGLVIMEAMSSGLPVVTSRETMNRLFAGERIDGKVIGAPELTSIYPASVAGVRQAIEEAQIDRARLASIRPAVRSFAVEHFGYSNAQKLMGILRDAAGHATVISAR